jgi:putative ABC transport system permease protein
MSGLNSDVLQSARALQRRPGYALTVIATFALGIGAVAAVFTLLDAVLLKPLPYPDAERLVLIRNQNASGSWNTSVADLQGILAQQRSFSAVASMRTGDMVLTSGGEPQWVSARSVTAQYFDVMGLAPARGRAFRAGEDLPGAPRSVVLGHAFAARSFGDADPIGRTLTLDGNAHEVIGVMAPGVEALAAMRADLWPVMQLSVPTRRGPFFLGTLARLAPEATQASAAADLEAISRRLFPQWQAGFHDETARLAPSPLRDAIVGGSGGFLWVAFAAVLALLAIAVVNVANLMLLRATERAPDLAVRRALGADERRLARLLVGESLLLALVGAAAGVALAAALLELYLALGPNLPRLAEVAIGGRVLALAAVLAVVCGVGLGLAPLAFTRGAGAPQQSRGASAGRGQQLLRDGLVAMQFALALPLLVSAGLLVHSMLELARVDPGFDAAPVLTAKVKLQQAAHPDGAAQLAFWQRALPELAAIPGVSAVGLSNTLPPSCGCYNNFDIVGRPAAEGQEPQSPWIPVSDGYFDALALPLVEGRRFDARDTPESQRVVIVTASWAARYFPGESAIGKQLYEGGDREQPVTVIGVVGDARFDGLQNPGETVFAPTGQGWPNNPTYIHLRGAVAPTALIEPLRATLARLDPTLVPTEVTTMSSLLGDSLGDQRHWAAVIGGFALSALLLSAIGAFGVLAAYVARQQREIGIRLALGADKHRVVRNVLGRGFRWAAAGCGVGVLLALFLTRGLESLLFGVERLDPLNLLGACAVLLAIAYAACWLPARRAADVDPMVALRHE